MKNLRLLLILPAAVVELFLLVSCWVIATISPSVAERMMRAAIKILPEKQWYVGN